MGRRPRAAFFKVANLAIRLRHPILVGKYRRRFGRMPDVCLPGDQTERMLWRKIFDRNPLYALMMDKLAMRAFVRSRCPDLPLSEIVWVGTEATGIPDALLGNGYVVKANNGSGRNIFPGSGAKREDIIATLSRWLRQPYGVNRGEWAYRNVQPTAYVEKRVAAPPGGELTEFNCQVAMGRCFLVSALQNVKQPTLRRAAFDREGNRLPFFGADPTRERPVAALPDDFRLPAVYPTLVRYAETLGRDSDYARVDFLCAGERFQFGEFTVYHSSGYERFTEPLERIFAANWDLRHAWFMRQCWRGPLGWYAAAFRAALDERSRTAWCRRRYFGASTMVIWRPSILGVCSTLAFSSTAALTRSSRRMPSSLCTISRPRNRNVTFTLSPSSRKVRMALSFTS